MPGRILRIDDEGFDIRLNGGVLRVQPKGSKTPEGVDPSGTRPNHRLPSSRADRKDGLRE